MHKQKGSITSIVIVILAVSYLLFWVWCLSDAPAENIAEVSQLADKSPDAKADFSEFLMKHPAPTNGDLNDIKIKVNKMVVLEQSRTITGHAELKSPDKSTNNDEDKSLASKKPSPVIKVAEGVQGWVLNISLFIGIVLLFITGLLKLKGRYDQG